VNKEIEDESFDPLGLSYFSDVLCKTTDATLLLNYAPVVLEKDPVIGAQVCLILHIIYCIGQQ